MSLERAEFIQKESDCLLGEGQSAEFETEHGVKLNAVS
jgi:hypothetical protein